MEGDRCRFHTCCPPHATSHIASRLLRSLALGFGGFFGLFFKIRASRFIPPTVTYAQVQRWHHSRTDKSVPCENFRFRLGWYDCLLWLYCKNLFFLANKYWLLVTFSKFFSLEWQHRHDFRSFQIGALHNMSVPASWCLVNHVITGWIVKLDRAYCRK